MRKTSKILNNGGKSIQRGHILDTTSNLSVDEHFKYTSPCKNKGILILHMSYSVPWVVFDGGLHFII